MAQRQRHARPPGAPRGQRAAAATPAIIPVMFFVLALFLASIGPGNIATAALLAPMAMAVGAPGRHSAVPDGDHGRQRRQGRVAVAVRADRHHRQRPDGPDRPGRHRVDDLRQQPDGPRRGHLRRLLPVRRLEAVHAVARSADGADAADAEPFESAALADARRAGVGGARRDPVQPARRHGGARRRRRSCRSPRPATRRRRSSACRGASS